MKVILYKFIYKLLIERYSCLEWRGPYIFRINDFDTLAKLWGILKHNPKMSSEKIKRSLRTYYNNPCILVPTARRTYKFMTNDLNVQDLPQIREFDLIMNRKSKIHLKDISDELKNRETILESTNHANCPINKDQNREENCEEEHNNNFSGQLIDKWGELPQGQYYYYPLPFYCGYYGHYFN